MTIYTFVQLWSTFFCLFCRLQENSHSNLIQYSAPVQYFQRRNIELAKKPGFPVTKVKVNTSVS